MFTTNTDIPIITGAEIIEWDMKSGNTSVMLTYNLAPIEKIKQLMALPKKKRTKIVGLMMKNDKEFSKNLEKGFNSIVKEFIEKNHLEQNDIISIKRDAIFVKNREIIEANIGTFASFVPKNHYHAFLLLKNLEFYFKKNGDVDIKGIPDEYIHLHKNGMISFLNDVIKIIEMGSTKKDLHQFIRIFSDIYMKGELPFEYYRNMNASSMFTMRIIVDEEESVFETQDITEDMINILDISYNYTNIILPLIQIIL